MHTVKFKPTLSYATHSHMHTVGLVITTSSFFFLRVWPGLMSPTWPLDPLLGWLLLLPTQPSVCETFRSLRFNLSLSYTDTHLYVFSLDLHWTVIINNIIRKWSSWTRVSTQNDLMSWREIVRCGGGGWTCHGSPGWGSSIWRVVSEWRVVRDGEWSMFRVWRENWRVLDLDNFLNITIEIFHEHFVFLFEMNEVSNDKMNPTCLFPRSHTIFPYQRVYVGFCTRSGSSSNPSNRQITWSCGGCDKPNQDFFILFYFLKQRFFVIFYWFFYGFRGESLTSWPELIGVINGEYTSWYPCHESAWGSCHTYTVLYTTPSRVTVVLLLWGRNRLGAALKSWRSFPPEPWKHQYLLTGPIPKKVRLETSSSTRCSHTSTTRTQSPFPKSTPFYSSYLWVTNLNFFSTQLLVPGTIPNFSSQRCPRQKCPGHTCLFSFGDQSSRVWPYPHLSGLTFSSSLATALSPPSRHDPESLMMLWE